MFHLTSPGPSVLQVSVPEASLSFCDILETDVLTAVCFSISEVRLYLMILEKLEHYEKALGVLRSNLAGKHRCLYIRHACCQFYLFQY